MSANDAETERERRRVRQARGQAPAEGDRLGWHALALDREAEELGQLPDEDREREPVQRADPDRLRQQFGEDAEAEDAERDAQRPRDEREAGRRSPARAGSPSMSGGDRRRDDRGERRVGSEHEDRARPEDGVDEERQDRRVQAGDGGRPAAWA